MVNTFWVASDPRKTAQILDNVRLNKQIVEAVQLLNVLQDIKYLADYYNIEYSIENIAEIRKKYRSSEYYLRTKKYSTKAKLIEKDSYIEDDKYRISKGGYWSHPATLMWFYHPTALKVYCNVCREEHLRRGGKTRIPEYQIEEEVRWPFWIKKKSVQISHRQSLVRKYPEHYRQYFPKEKEFDDYVWLRDIEGY